LLSSIARLSASSAHGTILTAGKSRNFLVTIPSVELFSKKKGRCFIEVDSAFLTARAPFVVKTYMNNKTDNAEPERLKCFIIKPDGRLILDNWSERQTYDPLCKNFLPRATDRVTDAWDKLQ